MEAKVVGIFLDRGVARNAVNALVEAGFRHEDISVAARQYGEVVEAGTKAGEVQREREEGPPASRTLTGAVMGGVLGGIGGLIVGLGGTAIPGLGVLVVGGPLSTAIGGAAVGAAGGGLVGAIRDLGLTEEQVDGYMTSIEAGAVLVAVHTSEDRAEEAANILRRLGVRDLHRISRRDRQVY